MDENFENETNKGIVKISDEVVAIIAGLTATKIKGILGMSTGPGSGITQMLGGKKNLSKGVKVEIKEDSAVIELYIIVEYGMSIPDIVSQAQENVKRAVESMTGLNVSAVNVFVQNVELPETEILKKETEE